MRADYAPFEADLRPPADDDGFDRLRFLDALKRLSGAARAWASTGTRPRPRPAEALINSLAMALPFDAAGEAGAAGGRAPSPSAARP